MLKMVTFTETLGCVRVSAVCVCVLFVCVCVCICLYMLVGSLCLCIDGVYLIQILLAVFGFQLGTIIISTIKPYNQGWPGYPVFLYPDGYKIQIQV